MVCKKTLRLSLYDYQRTARYYTIYRTFKNWSSDDFATIPRLFYWRNYDYWLRLFRLERYDYCWPLLAIGRKPEKSCGASRQWFRAAVLGKNIMPDVCQDNARLIRCQGSSRQAWEVLRPRRAGIVCDLLHCLVWIHSRKHPLHPYIPYYNRAAVLSCTVPGVASCIWYALEVLRRCDTL